MIGFTTSRDSDGMRYEEGDVVIQLSQHPSGILLVHSDVLAECSEYFRAMLKSHGWSSYHSMKDKNGDTKRIWHMQMFFGRELKMCLLTDKSDLITRQLDNQRPFDHLIEPQGSNTGSDADAEHIEPLRQLYNSVLPKQPRKQFLWNEPQPTAYPLLEFSSVNPSHTTQESTYRPYFECSAWMRDDSIDAHYKSPMKTHHRTQQHAVKILKTFIALIYGQDIEITNDRLCFQSFCLLSDVVVYATYYGALECVAPRLEAIILSCSNTWEVVASSPGTFTIFAYLIKSERLFIDSVKHLTGREIEGKRGLLAVISSAEENGHGQLDTMIDFLGLAYEQLETKIYGLSFHLSQLPLIQMPFLRREDYSEPVWSEWASTTSKCARLARSALAELSQLESPRGRDYTETHTRFVSCWKRRIVDGYPEIWASNLADQAGRDFGVDPNKVRRWLDVYIQDISECFRRSRISSHDHHCCQEFAPGVNLERRFCRDCLYYCGRCLQAEVKGDHSFTYLDIHLYSRWLRPLQPSENSKSWYPIVEFDRGIKWTLRELNPSRPTQPASDEYLKLINLDQCIHPKTPKIADDPFFDSANNGGYLLAPLSDDVSNSALPDWST